VEERSKVMEKWQIVIPKKIREAARIRVGEVLGWRYEAGTIILTPPGRVQSPSKVLYGLIPSGEDAVKEVEGIRRSRLERVQR